jgi:hypothetical protein
MDEERLCLKLEDCYMSAKLAEKDKGNLLDIHVERLSYLVLLAGNCSRGSERLDAILSRIQRESPTLAVPRFVMTPAELEGFIDDMGSDDANDLVYSAYRKKVRTMSEWIDQAKNAIARRTGFKFDPSVRVIRGQ